MIPSAKCRETPNRHLAAAERKAVHDRKQNRRDTEGRPGVRDSVRIRAVPVPSEKSMVR
jgi:hypothetical protein